MTNDQCPYYKLDGNTPTPVTSFTEWADWMNTANLVLMKNEFNGVYISTVFVGIDINPDHSGEPMLFETLVMGGVKNGYKQRYPNYDDALKGHLEMCTQIFKLTNNPTKHCKNCGYLAEDWAAGTGKYFCSHPETDFVEIEFNLAVNPAQDCDFFESRDCDQ
jgi:hypothetical protein